MLLLLGIVGLLWAAYRLAMGSDETYEPVVVPEPVKVPEPVVYSTLGGHHVRHKR